MYEITIRFVQLQHDKICIKNNIPFLRVYLYQIFKNHIIINDSITEIIFHSKLTLKSQKTVNNESKVMCKSQYYSTCGRSNY